MGDVLAQFLRFHEVPLLLRVRVQLIVICRLLDLLLYQVVLEFRIIRGLVYVDSALPLRGPQPLGLYRRLNRTRTYQDLLLML